MNQANHDGWTPLIAVCISEGLSDDDAEDVVEALLEERDIDVNAVDRRGRSAFVHACRTGKEEAAEELLERRDFDTDLRDADNNTPLIAAVRSGNDEVKPMTEQTCKHYSNTPQFIFQIVEEFLERRDVDLNAVGAHGLTALAWAADLGHAAIVRRLARRPDCDVNLADEEFQTPLYLACSNRNAAAALALLRARTDVDVNAVSESGGSPLYVASQWPEMAEVVDLLRQRGAIEPRG